MSTELFSCQFQLYSYRIQVNKKVPHSFPSQALQIDCAEDSWQYVSQIKVKQNPNTAYPVPAKIHQLFNKKACTNLLNGKKACPNSAFSRTSHIRSKSMIQHTIS
jgi:hypothetical protein